MSDNASFQMKFCGPAVDGGVMDVNELASTLLSMGDLIKAANNQINGEGSSVSIKIEAFQKGSFGIDFAVFADHTHKVLSFFGNSDVSGALNLIGILGLFNAGKTSLISLVKWIGEKRLRSVKENDDTAQFTLENGEKMTVGRDVVALYRNVDIRGKMELCFAR